MVWTLISILIIVGAGVYGVRYLSHIESLQISTIDVTGAESVKKEDVVAPIQSVLTGEYLGIISRSFSLFFPEESARASILEAVPRIASVDFKNVGKTLEVKVSERTPDSLICASVSSCLYADKDGFIYAEAPQVASGGLPKIIYSDKVSVGTLPFGKLYKELVNVISKARSIGIPTNSVVIGDTDDAGYVTYEILMDPNGKIFFNNRVPFIESLEHLALFWENRRKVVSNEKFEYIDLRFGNNVIYKIESND
jgi:hypothetical protein